MAHLPFFCKKMGVKRKREWTWRYHGNYVGPGWSAGKYQNSVAYSDVPAVDEFDQTAKDHDQSYALNEDLKKADYKFFWRNVGKGFKRTAAAVAVGAQGLMRPNLSLPQKDSDMGSRSRSAKRTAVTRGRSRTRAPPTPKRPASRSKAPTRASKKSRKTGSRPRNVGPASTNFTGRIGHRNKSVTSLGEIMKKGVQVCSEQSSIETAQEALYLGHACCPSEVAKRCFWRALVKMILARSQKLNPQWDGVPADVAVGDTWNVEYRDTRETDSSGDLIQYTVTYTAGLTQEGIANILYTHFRTAEQDFTFNRILYRPLGAHVGGISIPLTKATVTVDVLSTMKFQNQSVTLAEDDTADEVNNVPLIGKTYHGKGTGTRYVVDERAAGATGSFPFYCDSKFGVILRKGDINALAEPPSAKLFENVQKSGKLHIGPGDIQTSVIKYRKSLPLANFIAIVFDGRNDTAAGSGRFKMKYLGEFKFYGFEKQIDAVAPTAENNIRVAYEHDLKFACMITPHKPTITTQLFEEQIGGI